jgi:hypothetical protein
MWALSTAMTNVLVLPHVSYQEAKEMVQESVLAPGSEYSQFILYVLVQKQHNKRHVITRSLGCLVDSLVLERMTLVDECRTLSETDHLVVQLIKG